MPTSPSDLKAQHGQPVAYNGVCLVTLVQRGQVVYGKPLYWWNHQGQTYYFATPGAVVSFPNNPDRYLPYNDGYCVVTQAETGRDVHGDPRFAQMYKGNLYLFAGSEELAKFNKTFVAPPETNDSEVALTMPVQTVSAKSKPTRQTEQFSRSNTSAKTPEREGRISGLFRRVFKR